MADSYGGFCRACCSCFCQWTLLRYESFFRLHSPKKTAVSSNDFFALNDAGSAFGTRENRKFSFSAPVNLRGGANRIALLSVAVGLPVSIKHESSTLFVLSFLLQTDKDISILCGFEECWTTF